MRVRVLPRDVASSIITGSVVTAGEARVLLGAAAQ